MHLILSPSLLNRSPVPALHTSKSNLDPHKCAGDDIGHVQRIKRSTPGLRPLGWSEAQTVHFGAFFVFAAAVGPLEYQAEDDGFDASHEAGDSEVDVVVGRCFGWGEEFSIQEMEN